MIKTVQLTEALSIQANDYVVIYSLYGRYVAVFDIKGRMLYIDKTAKGSAVKGISSMHKERAFTEILTTEIKASSELLYKVAARLLAILSQREP